MEATRVLKVFGVILLVLGMTAAVFGGIGMSDPDFDATAAFGDEVCMPSIMFYGGAASVIGGMVLLLTAYMSVGENRRVAQVLSIAAAVFGLAICVFGCIGMHKLKHWRSIRTRF